MSVFLQQDQLQQAIALSQQEERLRQSYEDQFQQAIALSQQEERLRQSYEDQLQQAIALSQPTSKNDCLETTIKKLYPFWNNSKSFRGDIRDIIQQIAISNFGPIEDLSEYEVDQGQQLSKDSLDAVLKVLGMQVAYIRMINGNPEITEWVGNGRKQPGYGILHTVNSDFGVQGEQRHAGHYEAVMYVSVNGVCSITPL